MEYLLGSIVTIALLFFARRFVEKPAKTVGRSSLIYSQSYVFNIVKPYLQLEMLTKPIKTQASDYIDSLYVRVILVENKAYWISNNIFYVADEEDGFINKETAKPVDIMSMDKVQLDKMIFIVETLTEGVQNENRDSGDT
jgi:hypothetical protein